jgi:hypothetical protein
MCVRVSMCVCAYVCVSVYVYVCVSLCLLVGVNANIYDYDHAYVCVRASVCAQRCAQHVSYVRLCCYFVMLYFLCEIKAVVPCILSKYHI